MAYDRSEVLGLYLGAGESGGYSPVGHEERLRAAFPFHFTSARESIEKYLQFPDYPPTEWASKRSGGSARHLRAKACACVPGTQCAGHQRACVSLVLRLEVAPTGPSVRDASRSAFFDDDVLLKFFGASAITWEDDPRFTPLRFRKARLAPCALPTSKPCAGPLPT